MGTFEITSTREPTVLILRPEGYINDRAGQALREQCETALATDLRQIVINFEASDNINSVGISNLIAVIERMEEIEGRLVFVGLSEAVRGLFDMMGITRHVAVCQSADEARGLLDTPDA